MDEEPVKDRDRIGDLHAALRIDRRQVGALQRGPGRIRSPGRKIRLPAKNAARIRIGGIFDQAENPVRRARSRACGTQGVEGKPVALECRQAAIEHRTAQVAGHQIEEYPRLRLGLRQPAPSDPCLADHPHNLKREHQDQRQHRDRHKQLQNGEATPSAAPPDRFVGRIKRAGVPATWHARSPHGKRISVQSSNDDEGLAGGHSMTTRTVLLLEVGLFETTPVNR